MSNDSETVQVSFRLQRTLVERLRQVSASDRWPPPPSQTEIVSRGIAKVLQELERRREKRKQRAAAS